MIKKQIILLILGFSFISASCQETKLPDRAYRIDDQVRRIDRAEKRGEIKKFPIDSYVKVPSDSLGTITITVEDSFVTGAIFFKGNVANLLNKDGFDILKNFVEPGVSYAPGESQEIVQTSLTNLLTYHKKKALPSKSTHDFDTSNYPRFTVLGEVGDVVRYTVFYSDLDWAGRAKASGSFDVYFLVSDPIVSTFIPEGYGTPEG